MYNSVYPIEKMAEKIEFVSFDLIKIKNSEMKSHWFKYENIDLYYYQNQNGLLAKFHISMFGQVMEWAPIAGVRTGLLVEEERQGQVFEIIQYDDRANAATLAQALLVLKNANSVAAAVREELIGHIEDIQSGRPSRSKKISKWRQMAGAIQSQWRELLDFVHKKFL